MTNAEKYKDAIMAQLCKTGKWAVNKANEIMSCDACSACLFRYGGYCPDERKRWLNAEAVKEFSEKDKEVIRALDKVQWVARDNDGKLFAYTTKPFKSEGYWYSASPGSASRIDNLFTAEFASVKWEDKEPTSREEILGEEK